MVLAKYGRMRQIAVRLLSRGWSLLTTSVETGGNRWEQVDVYKVLWRCPVTVGFYRGSSLCVLFRLYYIYPFSSILFLVSYSILIISFRSIPVSFFYS